MHPVFLLLSAVSALLAVTMGAFSAHALKAVLAPDMLAVYKTAVTYQMWHALGLGIIALLRQQNPGERIIVYAGWLMFAGIILFSGSLYILSLSSVKWLGMIAPIGGLCFLSAWLLVSIFAYKACKSGNT
jgi:uncharacterized membrane protein YgdD (TMEM256/DUF423 family)